MDYALRLRLPLEIVEIICEKVHRINMKCVMDELEYNSIFININDEIIFYVIKPFSPYIKIGPVEMWKRIKTKLNIF